jgi:hypothetical protein
MLLGVSVGKCDRFNLPSAVSHVRIDLQNDTQYAWPK